MDCMQGMKEFPNKYFDLAIVDPPYGIGENGDKNHTRGGLTKAKDYKAFSGMDLKPPSEKYFDELFRVSKNQIIWGANHFISKMPFDSSCWIVWDKDNGDNDFADCELAWTSFSTAVRRIKYRWAGMLQQNMKLKENRIHPTQKPVAVLKKLIEIFTDEGDVVIDPCCGSGSTLRAAAELGRSAYGFEIDRNFYERAKNEMLVFEKDNQMNISDFI